MITTMIAFLLCWACFFIGYFVRGFLMRGYVFKPPKKEDEKPKKPSYIEQMRTLMEYTGERNG